MARARRLLICTQAVDQRHPALGFFHGWIEEFGKHAERIDVICLTKGVYALPPHIHVHSLGKEVQVSRLMYVLRFYFFFMRTLVIARPDTVLLHMGAIYNVLALPFFLIRRLLGVTFLWWKTHGKVGTPIERLALFGCDAVLTAGGKSFPLKTDKVRVVGHAIDTHMFRQVHEGAISPSETVLLMVGRIVPIKRIEVALAMLAAWDERDTPRPRLILVGAPDDPLYEAELKAYAEAHGIGESLVWVGSVQHEALRDYYAKSHILLHPAYEAGFDKVVLEAMASGVIPVTSIPSFAPTLETHGLFVAPNDHQGYMNAVKRIQRLSQKEVIALRTNLREEVEAHHALSTMFTRIFAP